MLSASDARVAWSGVNVCVASALLHVLTLVHSRAIPSLQRLGCNAELVVDEFGEKLLEELDYMQVRL